MNGVEQRIAKERLFDDRHGHAKQKLPRVAAAEEIRNLRPTWPHYLLNHVRIGIGWQRSAERHTEVQQLPARWVVQHDVVPPSLTGQDGARDPVKLAQGAINQRYLSLRR